MKTMTYLTGLAVLFSSLFATSLHAQNLTNLAGIWNGLYFNVPSQLTTEVSSGIVTDVPQSSAFSSGTLQANVYSNGTFTNGADVGTVAVTGPGMVTVTPAGQPPISFQVNKSEDVFVGISTESDGLNPENGLNVIVRSPASIATNDVVGTWRIEMFDTPQELIKIFAPTTNGSGLKDLLGFDNNSIDGSSFSQIGSGYMTLNADGTLSGNAGDPFTGSFSPGTNGEVEVNIETPDGPFSMTAFVNMSKNTVVARHTETNRQEVIVMTKVPTNVFVADLRGTWKVTYFAVPSVISFMRDSSNFITGLNITGGFSMNQEPEFAAGSDGFLTGHIEGVPTIGAFSATADGIVTATFTNSIGETQAHTGYLNESRDCIVLTEAESGHNAFTTITKISDQPGPSQYVGLQFFGGAVVWAGDTNSVLQSVDSLDGTWTNISGTLDQHEYPLNLTKSAEFYRVQIQ